MGSTMPRPRSSPISDIRFLEQRTGGGQQARGTFALNKTVRHRIHHYFCQLNRVTCCGKGEESIVKLHFDKMAVTVLSFNQHRYVVSYANYCRAQQN